jgi:choline kinase
MKSKIFFLIPARISNKQDQKNFIKYNRKYLLIHKINSLLKTKLGSVYVVTNSKKILKIIKSTNAKSIFIKDSSKSKKSTMLYSISMALKKINNEISNNDYVAVSPMQNVFLESKSIISACKKIITTKKINSLNTYYNSSNLHPCKIIEKKNNLIKFDVVKFKNIEFSKTEKTSDLPLVSYSSCALRISKYTYLDQLSKKENYDNFIVDIKFCAGFQINEKEAFEINSKKDLKYARYLDEYVK